MAEAYVAQLRLGHPIGKTPTLVDVQVRALEAADWAGVAGIFAAGNALFTTTPSSWEEWDATHRSDLRFVADIGGRIVGWVAADDVSDGCCDPGVIESRVGVHPDHQGRGIGRRLLTALIEAADEAGIRTVQARILPENAAGVTLHHRCGFRTGGRSERPGQLNEVWPDVLLLERRQPDPAPNRVRQPVPVGCTLDESEVQLRAEQWREILDRLVSRTDRRRPRELRLILTDDPAGISDIIGLSRAEKQCCSFFDFTLVIDGERTTLVIEVPSGSEHKLDDFVRLISAG